MELFFNVFVVFFFGKIDSSECFTCAYFCLFLSANNEQIFIILWDSFNLFKSYSNKDFSLLKVFEICVEEIEQK